jgi:predicted metalloprotease
VLLFAAVAVAAVAGGGSGPQVTFTPGGQRSSDASYERDLRVLLDDIEGFWRKEYPKVFGSQLPALQGGVVPARPGAAVPRCGDGITRYEDVRGNAFYCRLNDTITYDDASLFPELDERYGVVALAIVLAHEWGHAVQQRARFDAAPVIVELQADCYAGSWLAHADRTFSSLGDDEKIDAMTAMLSFSDPVGTQSDDEGAHGSAFDRVSAFTDGLRNGTRTCAAYDDDRPTFQLPFRTADELRSGGNLPFDELIASLVDVLQVPIEPASRTCPVAEGEYVVWCDAKQRLVYAGEARELAAGIGDFSVGFLVLLALAESDRSADPYCQIGTQVRLLLEGEASTELSLSPGDLDEAVITLLFTVDAPFWDLVDDIGRLGSGLTAGRC